MTALVGRQKRAGVDVESQQVADRILVLGSIQAPQSFGAAGIRFGQRRRIQRCFEPRQHRQAIAPREAAACWVVA